MSVQNAPRSTHKTIDHPDFGVLVLGCDTLRFTGPERMIAR
jgi:hypothetical protein